MILAHRLAIPDNELALLWDMDGVLLDTLTFDFELCNRLLAEFWSENAAVSRSVIRANFAYDLPEFWRRLVEVAANACGETPPAGLIDKLVEAHERQRRDAVCPVNEGVQAVLEDARAHGLKLAVVSNNPTAEVRRMLEKSGIFGLFDCVVGNDLEDVAKKPAPDSYLLAARQLGVDPASCVVVEDSLLGAEAGHRAGCHTVAVATGADDFDALAASGFVDQTYLAFTENRVRLSHGNVTDKTIATPNEFVSHMIEHIAWRMGCSLTLNWNNGDWFALGRQLGESIAAFERLQESSAVLGMIDDGSAEVALTAAGSGELTFGSTEQVDLDWFLSLRCEQLANGTPLVELLEGLAGACSSRIEVTVCSLEDPHHTWEGIFRSVGIALSRIYNPPESVPARQTEELPSAADVPSETGWKVLGQSVDRAEVTRETGETRVRVAIDCRQSSPVKCRFDVSDSIRVEGFRDLLGEFCRAAGIGVEVEFVSKFLSSSHVVTEDIGMVLGRAIKEILVARMQAFGVNGAGCSVQTPADLQQEPIRVGLSVEGRKFLQWVPFSVNHGYLKRHFIIGHTVGDGMFSEDLDDFLDGFAGGLSASILVHLKECPSPAEGWPLIFRGLGAALADALAPNGCRKGVPPGVKATLA